MECILLTKSSCLRESQFKFLIGPKEETFYIHPGIVQKVSGPLYKLIANGKLEESLTRIGRLPVVDAETFVNFCEYAYSGGYRVQGKTSCGKPVTSKIGISLPLQGYHCWSCGSKPDFDSTNKLFPFCQDSCRWQAQNEYTNERKCIVCGRWAFSAKGTGHFNSKVSVVCPICTGTKYSMSLQVIEAQSKAVRNMNINVGSMTQIEMEQYLLVGSPADVPVDNLVAHARLWVFANMYMVGSLEELCLHKLHRDLLALDLTEETVPKVTELAAYVYGQESTTIDPANAKLSPRTLTLAYMAQNSESLLKYDDFKQFIDMGGEVVMDLFAEMGKLVTLAL